MYFVQIPARRKAVRNSLKVFDEGTVSDRTCSGWFEALQIGELNLSDKPQSDSL